MIGSRACLLLGVVGAVWLLSVNLRGQSDGPPQLDAVTSELDIPTGAGSETLRRRCLRCHATELIRQQRLSRGAWERELAKMISWGAVVDDSEKQELVDYLALHFGIDRRAPRELGDLAASGAALLEAKCQTCHDSQLIAGQRLDISGWGREVDKMTNWGARVSASEKDVLVQYLAARFGR